MKNFFYKNKKWFDIYIIIILISIIIALIFIIFPEITHTNIVNTKLELLNNKNKIDNYIINKFEPNNTTEKINNNEIIIKNKIEDNIEDNMEEKNTKTEISIDKQKYLLNKKDEKIYNVNETFLLNFTKNKYEKKGNESIILDKNNIDNIACILTNYSFDLNNYKLTLTFNFKNLSNNSIDLNLNKFYIRFKDSIIIKALEEKDILINSKEEIDNIKIDYIFDKNIDLNDLNLSYIKACYNDDLNIREINLLKIN